MVIRVSHTVFHQMPPAASWDEFANRFPGAAHLLEAQQELGLDVSWIGRSTVSRAFTKHGIKVRLVHARWNPGRHVALAIREENPEVIHLHGLNSWTAL